MKLSEKSKLSHSFIAGDQGTEKRSNAAKSTDELVRTMEKKKSFEPVGYTRLETLVEQNKFLLTENNELANLLSERNRIIAALEQKLEQQIAQ
jgi:predicted RNase H-like nuclease (RuvC/YqgF family)